jgi:hypothetical protein
MCQWEIAIASASGKRIIPLILEGIELDSHPSLAQYQSIPSQGRFDVTRHSRLLVESIERNVAWERSFDLYRELSFRWKVSGRRRDILLGSTLLRDARAMLHSRRLDRDRNRDVLEYIETSETHLVLKKIARWLISLTILILIGIMVWIGT